MREAVLILTGPPGVGKTTVARLLANDAQRAVHLESDLFFRFIQAGYVEPWRPESHGQNVAVMSIVAGAAAGYADAGYFTIIDGIVSPRWFFEPLCDALRAAGQAVAYAVLRAPLEVCVSRAVARESPSLADTGVIEQLWRDFAECGALEDHVLDSEHSGAAEIAEVITRRLGEGTLNV